MLVRLPKRQLAVLVLGWAAAAVIVLSLVAAGRRVALERGERSSAAFAAVVEQQTVRTFQAVQLTLAAVADAHQLTVRPAKNDPGFQQMMSRRLKDLPFVRALFIIGPDGWIIHDTDYPRTPRLPLNDRPYFRMQRERMLHEVTFSPPVLSRSGTGWFLPIAQRLGTAQFEGVVVAAVQTDYFSKQFETIDLADGDVIALFHRDGTLIARHPLNFAAIGITFAHLPMFREHLPKASAGTFVTDASFAPGERVVSYRAVAGTPYVVQVSRSNAAVLAEWRRTAVGAAIAMGALTVVLAWMVAYLVRQHAREERVRERRLQAEKMEAIGQFTSSIAHDFGNLLNVVGLNLALLRQSALTPPTVDSAFAAVDRAVDRGKDLIGRLLGFARRRTTEAVRTDVNHAITSMKPLLLQAAGSRVTLDGALAADLPPVLCDPTELEIALLNLVVNARDAMAGAGHIVLKSYACEEESVCVTVQDDGPGMPEDVKRRAMEPFYSTKGEAGTGLGLWQVYGFMHRLEGTARIDSAPGEGTAVTLVFPRASR
jgi:two-component system NtrC family sensor kinase